MTDCGRGLKIPAPQFADVRLSSGSDDPDPAIVAPESLDPGPKRTPTMWSRRHFLERLSTLPVVGGLVGAGGPARSGGGASRAGLLPRAGRPPLHQRGRHLHRDDRLAHAARSDGRHQYASKHYVMLDELHDKVGERIATLVHSEAAMVTSGAASALTLGTAAVLTGTDRQKMVDAAGSGDDEERSHHPEIAPLRLRPRRPQLRRAARRSGNAARISSAPSTRRPR